MAIFRKLNKSQLSVSVSNVNKEQEQQTHSRSGSEAPLTVLHPHQQQHQQQQQRLESSVPSPLQPPTTLETSADNINNSPREDPRIYQHQQQYQQHQQIPPQQLMHQHQHYQQPPQPQPHYQLPEPHHHSHPIPHSTNDFQGFDFTNGDSPASPHRPYHPFTPSSSSSAHHHHIHPYEESSPSASHAVSHVVPGPSVPSSPAHDVSSFPTPQPPTSTSTSTITSTLNTSNFTTSSKESQPEPEPKKSKRAFFGIHSRKEPSTKDNQATKSKSKHVVRRSLSVSRKPVSPDPKAYNLARKNASSASLHEEETRPDDDENPQTEGMQMNKPHDQASYQAQRAFRPQIQRLNTGSDHRPGEEQYVAYRREYDSPHSQRSQYQQSPSIGRRSPQPQEYHHDPNQPRFYAAQLTQASTDHLADSRRPSQTESYHRPSSRQSLGPPSPSPGLYPKREGAEGPVSSIRPVAGQAVAPSKMGPRPTSAGQHRGEPPQYTQQNQASGNPRPRPGAMPPANASQEKEGSPERMELTDADFHALAAKYDELRMLTLNFAETRADQVQRRNTIRLRNTILTRKARFSSCRMSSRISECQHHGRN